MLCRDITAACLAACAISLCPLTGLFQIAAAQTAQELAWCNGKDGPSAEQRIRGCTAAIESGKFSGTKLGLAFRLRGYAHLYAKSPFDADAAIRDYGEAIRLNPEDAAAFYGRADAQKIKAARSSGAERKNFATSAVNDFTQAIRLRASKQPLDFINRSNVYLLLDDYERAFADLAEALRLDPADKKEALVNLCVLYGRLGRWSEALADCNKSLTFANQEGQDPDRASDTWTARGYVHLRMGNYKDAVADYDSAIGDPHIAEYHRAEALFGRGLARKKLGDAASGEADMAVAVKSRPTIADYFSERGVR